MWSEWWLPDAHVTAAVFSGATVDMLEVLLRTRAKAAAGGEHNRDEKGIALIALNNSGDSGASAPLALTCAEDAQDRVGASTIEYLGLLKCWLAIAAKPISCVFSLGLEPRLEGSSYQHKKRCK